MTVKEVAKALGVSQQSVRNYIVLGKLKSTKKRQGLRFEYVISETDLQEFKDTYMKE